jgi:hypothetical protein
MTSDLETREGRRQVRKTIEVALVTLAIELVDANLMEVLYWGSVYFIIFSVCLDCHDLTVRNEKVFLIHLASFGYTCSYIEVCHLGRG